ncbi:MAG: tetratricopeptide repeat protein [Polyangia bacterium]
MGFGLASLIFLSLVTAVDAPTPLPHQPEDVRRYREGAARGESWNQAALGWLYDMGVGVPQDHAEAVKWYTKAADQGFPEAQYNLATLYSSGRGVRRDYAKAYFWANIAVTLDPISPLAALNGRTEAKPEYIQFRDEVAAKLSPAQLAATQKRCRQWLDAFEKRKAQK